MRRTNFVLPGTRLKIPLRLYKTRNGSDRGWRASAQLCHVAIGRILLCGWSRSRSARSARALAGSCVGRATRENSSTYISLPLIPAAAHPLVHSQRWRGRHNGGPFLRSVPWWPVTRRQPSVSAGGDQRGFPARSARVRLRNVVSAKPGYRRRDPTAHCPSRRLARRPRPLLRF
jgi:hypothetical protein